MPPSVLVIEDDAALASAIEAFLQRQGLPTRAFPSAEAALPALAGVAPDVALVDVHLPGMDGVAAMDVIRRERPETLVILMTAYSTVSSAVAAVKAGAVDYLTKPLDLEELWVVIQRAWESQRVRSELAYLRQRTGHAAPVESLLGTSPAIDEVRRRILQAARADRLGDAGPTVLIAGETGTGKELAARAIHAAGPRADGPFVEINCAAIPGALLEGELFGFERGAYTDARSTKPGLFEAADGGTLFLDEICLLDLALQAKLLRAIEDRAIRRLGGIAARRVDVRILAATNHDLEAAARDGAFRRDLFYRLRVLTVDLPPLRGRGDDIRLLAEHFLAQCRQRYGLGDVQLSAAAFEALQTSPWPGNVRELAHVVERAALLSPGCILEPEQLGLVPPAGVPVTVNSDGPVHVDFVRGAINLEAVERALIEKALQHTGWNRSRAAKLLGLTKETLRYRIEKYRLSP
ncbi:MAG: sigma-54-dependent Fis family transcriptional regulator [Candidatus Rokubacteria bacterium]|nr:sigma-54-dependent Fis family transcriptional regulator [Candidatus Rokubacteria bacterium]